LIFITCLNLLSIISIFTNNLFRIRTCATDETEFRWVFDKKLHFSELTILPPGIKYDLSSSQCWEDFLFLFSEFDFEIRSVLLVRRFRQNGRNHQRLGGRPILWRYHLCQVKYGQKTKLFGIWLILLAGNEATLDFCKNN
jgi:hypothetical protein